METIGNFSHLKIHGTFIDEKKKEKKRNNVPMICGSSKNNSGFIY